METFLTEQEILARIKIYNAKNNADQFKFEVGILYAKNRLNENRKDNGMPDTNPSDSIGADNKK
jgi:hypothetical protein